MKRVKLEFYSYEFYRERSINIKSLNPDSHTQYLYTSRQAISSFHTMFLEGLHWDVLEDSEFWRSVYTASFFKIVTAKLNPSFYLIHTEMPHYGEPYARQSLAQRATIRSFTSATLPMSPVITLRTRTEEGLSFNVIDNKRNKPVILFESSTPLTTYGSI